VPGQLHADPYRPIAAGGAVAGEGLRETAVVLVALAGQAVHRRLRLGRLETAGNQATGQNAAGVLPPHQQAKPALVGVLVVPDPAATVRRVGSRREYSRRTSKPRPRW